MDEFIGTIKMFAGNFAQLPHESFRVVHLTKNYKPKQHQETQIIMLILKPKNESAMARFCYYNKGIHSYRTNPFVWFI